MIFGFDSAEQHQSVVAQVFTTKTLLETKISIDRNILM
jgi:hypothetical protein